MKTRKTNRNASRYRRGEKAYQAVLFAGRLDLRARARQVCLRFLPPRFRLVPSRGCRRNCCPQALLLFLHGAPLPAERIAPRRQLLHRLPSRRILLRLLQRCELRPGTVQLSIREAKEEFAYKAARQGC